MNYKCFSIIIIPRIQLFSPSHPSHLPSVTYSENSNGVSITRFVKTKHYDLLIVRMWITLISLMQTWSMFKKKLILNILYIFHTETKPHLGPIKHTVFKTYHCCSRHSLDRHKCLNNTFNLGYLQSV